MFGLGIDLGIGPSRRRGSSVPTSVSSIDASGWVGTFSDSLPAYSTGAREFSPETVPLYAPLSRQGYNAACQPVTFPENLLIKRRVRQPYTGAANTHLLGDGSKVALSRAAYSTDTGVGFTNNSTERPGVICAQWQQRPRRVAGNSIYVEMVAFQGDAADGKPVAGARVQATDGTIFTPWVVMTGPAILPSTTDNAPVIGYYATIDVSALADGNCSYNCEVFPRVGGDAHVLRSTGGTLDGRGFTPQSFYKSATATTQFKGINPVYAFVAVTGGTNGTVDANGQLTGVTKISTNRLTAKAAPFATIASAVEALKAATNVTGGFTDGCIVELGTGQHSNLTNTLAGTYQQGGELIIRADPDVDPAGVSMLGWSALRQSWITVQNILLVRSTTVQLLALTGGRVAIENCRLDTTSASTAFFATTPLYINGLNVTAGVGTSTLVSGTVPVNMMRGVVAGTPLGTAITADIYNATGCRFGNAAAGFGGRDASGGVFAFSSIMGYTGGGFIAFASNTTGFALVQNVLEFATATTNPIARFSADNSAFTVTDLVEWNNTYAGAALAGRHNAGYDETIGLVRTNRRWSQIGNIYVTYYTKHDWFIGAVSGATDAEAQTHTGSWWCLYNVGSFGNLHQFPTVAGSGPGGGPNGNENPADFGISAKFSTTLNTRLDPLFVGGNGKATSVTVGGVYSAGSGGVPADYALQAGTPARSMVPFGVLPFDFGGTARSVTADTAGAYA